MQDLTNYSEPIRQSLVRPVLIAGAERELVIANYTIILALILGIGLNWITILASTFLATVGHWILVKLAEKEPELRKTYLRHISYRDYYPARNHPGNKVPKARQSM